MKEFFKRLFCEHNANHVWTFFPERVFVKDRPVVGLKISVCMDCGRIKAEDYAK